MNARVSTFELSTADTLATRLIVVFRGRVGLYSFNFRCRKANVAPIQKGPPSSSVVKYLPIPITLLLSNLFARLVSVRLRRLMKRYCVQCMFHTL